MMSTERETWLFRVQLLPGLPNPGRFMGRLLKHLLRAWGVKCVATLDPSSVAPVERSAREPTGAANVAIQTVEPTNETHEKEEATKC
ncbi:MAG TPA: hypothetical protein VMG10_12080 [Gemmataceae bacterium]|nr:hypothetical protein [Gemmataceae bacterium]